MSEEERSRSGTRENRRHGTCDGETVTGNSKVTMPVGTSPSNAPRQFGRWRRWTKLLQQTNTKQPIDGCDTCVGQSASLRIFIHSCVHKCQILRNVLSNLLLKIIIHYKLCNYSILSCRQSQKPKNRFQ